MVRAHIIFTGTVQGVGFRMTTQRFALNLGLKGWVKNRPDGAVEVCAEGGRGAIERLCGDLEAYFDSYIRDKDITFADGKDEFAGFQITH